MCLTRKDPALPRYDFTTHRLFVAMPQLAPGARVPLGREQANYLLNVLRLGEGSRCLIFNGLDGEWRAQIEVKGRKQAELVAQEQTRRQPPPGDLELAFAPLKHARLDYLVQKAVEMGASRLSPVVTRRTQVARLNLDRLAANAIEAAEQCGVLAVPAVAPVQKFEEWLAQSPSRQIVFCDEEAPVADPLAVLVRDRDPARGISVVIGPEGGFDDSERQALQQQPGVLRLSLGPRILRADTAAVAAMALVQASAGDWRG